MECEVGIRLGQRIRQLREARGLTQAELAGLILKSVETISNFERGKTLPSVLTLTALSRHLHIELRDLFDFEAPAPAESDRDPLVLIAGRLRLLPEEDVALAADFISLLVERRRTPRR
jgi:transcriptional regulator with XRE-family HTH domain